MSVELTIPVLTWPQIAAAAPPKADWLWEGYLATGGLTLLAGQWKAGKTTLLTALLARLKAGGELAGRPVRAGRALVVTEEGPIWWRERGQRFDLDGQVEWICRPFRTKPTPEQWVDLVE